MALQLLQSSLQLRHHRSVEPHQSHVSASGAVAGVSGGNSTNARDGSGSSWPLAM
jgi:hypothetical protein